MPSPSPQHTFPRSRALGEARRIATLLRKESIGGILLVLAAAVALIWANSPFADSYFALRDLTVGYEPWHLRLSLGAWAADGLLAIFFFLVGLELKREFVAGDLRNVRTAIVPISAAAGGVLAPALIYIAIVWPHQELRAGWAIPTATDIAFAVAVLAIIGSYLPAALRIFLLTLAVVDDLMAISIIAIFYTEDIRFVPLLLALGVIAVYGFIAQRYRELFRLRAFAAWLILLPIGAVAWALMHASGIHATIAGVLLGFMIPVMHRKSTATATQGRTEVAHGQEEQKEQAGLPGEQEEQEEPIEIAQGQEQEEQTGLAEEFEHRFRPLSAGFAVPVFAFFAAGVGLGGWDGVQEAARHPLTLAVGAALVLGKPLGIVSVTWLVTKVTRTRLDPDLRWIDLVGVSLLAGIGFTVSLLVAELSFASGSPEHDTAKVAILTASLTAAVLAATLLSARNYQYGKIRARDRVNKV